jgi:ribosomal protein S18 acetylase RimI-like enzyme
VARLSFGMLRQCSTTTALTQESITYCFLEEEKIAEAAECFSRCFEQENQIVATKVTYDEFFDWAVEYIRLRFRDKYSVCLVAKYSDACPLSTGSVSKIVGVAICEDVTNRDPDELYMNSTPKFIPLDALIAEMLQHYATLFLKQPNNLTLSTVQTNENAPHRHDVYSFLNYNAQYNLPKGEHFRIAFLAVSSEFRCHGIGRALVMKSIEIAKQRGYKYIVCEASSETSQRLFQRIGFKLIKLFKYKDFTWNGKHPLASITDSEGCALMGMKLMSS